MAALHNPEIMVPRFFFSRDFQKLDEMELSKIKRWNKAVENWDSIGFIRKVLLKMRQPPP
ncbi:MAG TPA: hypothetical protein VFP68_24165 [Burkholderiaceae bacterium]|nr:hypothetical protein [Burkholderiaceae bacterium]